MNKCHITLVVIAAMALIATGFSTGAVPVSDSDPIAIQPSNPAGSFEISRDAQTNKIVFVKVNPPPDSTLLKTSSYSPNPDLNTRDFLNTNKAIFGISNLNDELVTGKVDQDNLGMKHITYFQYYDDVPVIGGGMKVHLNNYGQVSSVSNYFVDGLALNTVPAIGVDQAKAMAFNYWNIDYPSLVPPTVGDASLVVLPKSLITNDGKGEAYLTWKVRLYFESDEAVYADETYYIDASNEDMVQKMSNNFEYGSCPTANMTIYPCRRIYDCDTFPGNSSCGIDYNTTEYPTYFFGRSEGRPTRGPDPRPNPPSMFGGSNNTDQTFDMFLSVHNYWNYSVGRFGANRHGGSSWGANVHYTRGFSHLDKAPIGLIYCPGGFAWFAGSNQAIHFCLNSVQPDMMGHEYAHAVLFYDFYVINYSSSTFNYTNMTNVIKDISNYTNCADNAPIPVSNTSPVQNLCNFTSGLWPVGPFQYGQSGALSESFADVFGELFERYYNNGTHDWILGGRSPMIWTRNLANPELNQVTAMMNYSGNLTTAYYPNHFYDKNYYCGSGDSGGIHIDSTVPSKAAYLMAAGGTFGGCEIQAIGEPALEKILYRTWHVYASSSESFNAFYFHMNQSCLDIYGSTHPEYCVSVVKAMQAVEMDQAGACSSQPEAAPACAVKNLGSVYTKKATGERATNFTPIETVWVGGENGIPGKTVNVHLLMRNGTLANWIQITSLKNVSTTILANGSINVSLGVVNQTGTYDIIVDGNRDGVYHQWADSISTFEVYLPTDIPPTVTLTSSNQTATAGQPFTITVTGSSPYSLASVWWGVREPGNLSNHNISGSVDGVPVNLAPAQGFGTCYGQTYCQFTRTVTIDDPGTYQIWANSRDTLYFTNPGEPHQASEGVGLAVVSMNINPAFSSMPTVKSVIVGKTLSFSVSAQDQNGDALRLEMATGVSGATFASGATVINSDGTSSIAGNFRWTPNLKQTGTYTVQFKVTDDKGGATLSAPVQINVVKNLIIQSEID